MLRRPGQGRGGSRREDRPRAWGCAAAGLKTQGRWRHLLRVRALGSTCRWDISPRDPDDTLSSWPKALVRQSDRVRFIRITGGRYTAGDFAPPRPWAMPWGIRS